MHSLHLTLNQEKFTAFKAFNLPIDQYVIMGSGPLGIRQLRLIQDIDIFVTEKLWKHLSDRYGITDNGEKKTVVFAEGLIEALHQGSFYNETPDPEAPTLASRIAQADIIDGLPFDSLKNTLYFKKKWAREKDFEDIRLIEGFLH